MKLFHGSSEVVEIPQILEVQRLLDFGKGFYTTTNQNQAERWAKIKQKRTSNSKAFVSVFHLANHFFVQKDINTKEFLKADEEWLDFVFENRKGNSTHSFDIIIGTIANDTLYATIALYESGILNKPETKQRLKVHKLFDQISFNTEKVLKQLTFFESY